MTSHTNDNPHGARPTTRTWVRSVPVILILLLAGVIVGSQLGRSEGFARLLGFGPPMPDNPTLLRPGERLDLEAVCASDAVSPHRLTQLAKERKLLLCFVTNGCDPCLQYVDLLSDRSPVPDETYQIVLLSTTPEAFRAPRNLVSLPVSESFLETSGIHHFPTTVGVDQKGEIALVIPGFMPDLSAEFIAQYF